MQSYPKTKVESSWRGVRHTQSYARRLFLVNSRAIVRTSIRHRSHRCGVLGLGVVRGRLHGSLVAQMYAMNSNSAIGILSLHQLGPRFPETFCLIDRISAFGKACDRGGFRAAWTWLRGGRGGWGPGPHPGPGIWAYA